MARATADVGRLSRHRRVLTGLLLTTGLGVLVAGCWVWQNAFRREPLPGFATPEEQFKYGALGYGTPGAAQGFPLYLWQVLPETFADKLTGPGGWGSFGLVTEPGRDYPVGFAKVTVGFPGLVPNCALCHSGTVRTRPDELPRLVLGAPAHQLDFDAFNNFVFACAADPRWCAAELLPRIEKIARLSWSERLFYRALIPALRREIVRQQGKFTWQAARPAAGCGRTDAFNRFKFNVLSLADDGTVGTSDYPPLWNQRQRDGLWLHWNGSGNHLRDEDLLSVLPIIQRPSDFDPRGFERVVAFLRDLQPPPFPFPVDAAQAARGKALFAQHCAACHAFGAAQTGQVTPLKEVRTDPAFLKMWSPNFVTRLQAIDSPPFQFPAIRSSEGYVNVPLDGVWLRAPYLHNGSVPTLWDLLRNPELRPTHFRRGYNVYDSQHVGFISSGPEAAATGTLYDTRQPGNGNHGHSYGTTLTDEEKWQLLEYLKTL
jgi:cytochrome c553